MVESGTIKFKSKEHEKFLQRILQSADTKMCTMRHWCTALESARTPEEI